MKTEIRHLYQTPELLVFRLADEDLLTASSAANGDGDVISWKDMKLDV